MKINLELNILINVRNKKFMESKCQMNQKRREKKFKEKN